MANPADYLSQEQWCRILALAWEDPEFKDALEKNPLKAVKEKAHFADFQQDFTYVIKIPDPPDFLDEQEIGKIASGEEEMYAIPYTSLC
jgi:hypothetical protein